jgi:hypothetical protein
VFRNANNANGNVRLVAVRFVAFMGSAGVLAPALEVALDRAAGGVEGK